MNRIAPASLAPPNVRGAANDHGGTAVAQLRDRGCGPVLINTPRPGRVAFQFAFVPCRRHKRDNQPEMVPGPRWRPARDGGRLYLDLHHARSILAFHVRSTLRILAVVVTYRW